jgi:ABC-type branched-subunit amino acid transport system substrate-binding protein
MLADQYYSSWVWPVAASTVSNMHIAVEYAYQQGARKFGIVYDERYKFGAEGAYAFEKEVERVSGQPVAGYGGQGPDSLSGCNQSFCGISSDQTGGYSSAITTFNSACSPCDMVMMLLEPQPMETWMKGEENSRTPWFKKLMGGEPLFDDNVGQNCPGCGNGSMIVWTGYRPAIQPFDAEKPVYTFQNSLKSAFPSDDPHNEFTEGAYLGTKLFLAACQAVGPNLTRGALQAVLNTQAFDFGLSAPLRYMPALPHLANTSMAAFQDNYSGSFNGWNYLQSDFITDPARGQDFR